MQRKLVNISVVLVALALLLALAPACSNVAEEPKQKSAPLTSEAGQNFLIEVVKPDDARQMDWALVVVWVTCTYQRSHFGYDVDVIKGTTVSVSFPDLSDVKNVSFWSSTLENHHTYAPGEKVYTDYGNGYQVEAQYPILEGDQRNMEYGDKEYIAFQVRPERSGKFTFYVKAYGYLWLETLYVTLCEPDDGTKDEQNEYVQVHSFQVLEPYQ